MLLVLGVLKTSINLSLLTSKNGITIFFNNLHVVRFIYVCSSQFASSQRFCILPMEHVLLFFESLSSRKAYLQYLFCSSISGLVQLSSDALPSLLQKYHHLNCVCQCFFFSASVFYSQMHLLCLTQTLHIGSNESMHSLKNQYIPIDSFCVCDNASFFLMRLSFNVLLQHPNQCCIIRFVILYQYVNFQKYFLFYLMFFHLQIYYYVVLVYFIFRFTSIFQDSVQLSETNKFFKSLFIYPSLLLLSSSKICSFVHR